MNGHENIVEYNKTRSTAEARENGRKGGIASGKARREKARLKHLAEDILNGTYQTEDGQTATIESLIVAGIVENLKDANGRNWYRAIDLLIKLYDSEKCDAEIEKIIADTDLTKAKTEVITSDKINVDIEDLKPLAELLAI